MYMYMYVIYTRTCNPSSVGKIPGTMCPRFGRLLHCNDNFVLGQTSDWNINERITCTMYICMSELVWYLSLFGIMANLHIHVHVQVYVHVHVHVCVLIKSICVQLTSGSCVAFM